MGRFLFDSLIRDIMQNQNARNEEPFFAVTATGDEFETALQNAARENLRSMHELQLSIRNCVVSLREDGMQCEQALITMKSFVKTLALRHRRRGSIEMGHIDLLMEQVVTWCISEFYAEQQ